MNIKAIPLAIFVSLIITYHLHGKKDRYADIPYKKDIIREQVEGYERLKQEEERRKKEAEEKEKQLEVEQQNYLAYQKELYAQNTKEALAKGEPPPSPLQTKKIMLETDKGPQEITVPVLLWPKKKSPPIDFKFALELFDGIPYPYAFYRGTNFILKGDTPNRWKVDTSSTFASLLLRPAASNNTTLEFFQFKKYDFIPNLSTVNTVGYVQSLLEQHRRNFTLLNNDYFRVIDTVANHDARTIRYSLLTPDIKYIVEDILTFINDTLLIIRFKSPESEYDLYKDGFTQIVNTLQVTDQFP